MSESVRAGLPQRLLRLLSLLQARREWTGPDLADRLGVSARTLRRDVDRLRELDYRIEGVPGVAGGYRLASGRDLPPLLLDDEEAVALALALVGAEGAREGALSALAKLERILPARLRPRLAAVRDSASAVPPRHDDTDPATLGRLAAHCRDRVVTALTYRPRSGEPGERRVEPHHLVSHGGHWYLIAHDTGRDDWRTFRVDRVDDVRATHGRFDPRDLPDPVGHLLGGFAEATYTHTVRLAVALPEAEVRGRLYGPFPGRIDPDGADRCRIRISADSPELVAQYTAAVLCLDADVTVEQVSPEISGHLRRAGRALRSSP
ncbi:MULTISPECIES: helix-turn-helix transcriptional regulator [unclassified Nocardiopsis]|uniref:helix-turn-helix transcriptional regulator n=1 Tax=Nocardiopsis TaxID=2013 RepID=UPI00387AF4DA